MSDGRVAQLHPVSARIPTSNGFYGRAVAIEFAGNLQAVNGQWSKPEKYPIPESCRSFPASKAVQS